MKKWIARLMCAVLLTSTILTQNTPEVSAVSNDVIPAEVKEDALNWICMSQNENGSFGDDRIPKDTCQVVELFHDLDMDTSNGWLENYNAEINDNDNASRFYCVSGNDAYFACIGESNEDGGYGLTEQYQSDCLDTMLVFEAMVRKYLTDGSSLEEIWGILQYFDTQQNQDGGFSYLPDMDSDYMLTAGIGIIAAALETYGQVSPGTDLLDNIDGYIKTGLEETDAANEFEKFAYGNIYLCLRRAVPDAEGLITVLTKLQNSDGSINRDLDDTMAAVRLAWALEEYFKPYLLCSDMATELSTYTGYVNYKNTVEIESVISYECNHEFDGTWRVTVYENEEPVSVKDTAFVFDKNKTRMTLTDEIAIDIVAGENYQIVTELILEGNVLFKDEESLYTTLLEIDEVELGVDGSNPAGIHLSWNDVSNDFCRYGYRVYRSRTGEDWETRSSWNGMETVRVLNIYPNPASKDYLKEWMTKDLQQEKVPAGKGLFEIDTVLIDAYNQNPDFYLKDENGYKYDVLMFGTYDRNADRDLSEKSYEATREFAESGRGVLFGHDTIITNSAINNRQFAKFADALGITLRWNTSYREAESVKVVNSGFLTSYPWKLSGVLNIPSTHASGQVTGGTNPATVWMEFTVDHFVDAATGAKDNAYLCTRNQFAMIQTGHSSGQATDDERKVLANTLFSLKQVTSATETIDRSAADLEQPGSCVVSDVVWGEKEITLHVEAEDFGTKYYYYVEAIPQIVNEESLRRESEIMETVVVSGIKGYKIAVNNSPDSCEDTEFGELLAAEDGQLILEEAFMGDATYLHIRAVDHQGNMGDETVIPLPEKPDHNEWMNTGYSLFGEEGVVVYCSALRAAGDIYSGTDITFGGSNIIVDGACDAVGNLNAYVGNIRTGSTTEHGAVCEMPNLKENIMRQLVNGETVERLDIYNTGLIENPVYCRQTVNVYCPGMVVNNTLVCEGDIHVGVDTARFGSEEETVVYSMYGNISINASRFYGKGMIYAPNGTVTINVSEMEYSGSIIAKRINIQGTELLIGTQDKE